MPASKLNLKWSRVSEPLPSTSLLIILENISASLSLYPKPTMLPSFGALCLLKMVKVPKNSFLRFSRKILFFQENTLIKK